MTKMKSKKMTKSTFAIIIMAIAMVAMLAFGGTYAYFTATATAVSGSTKTGIISLSTEQTKVDFLSKAMLPTESTTQTISYVDNSNRGTFVFWKLSTAWTKTESIINDPDADKAKIEITDITVNGTSIKNNVLTEKDTGDKIYYHTNGTDDEANGTVSGIVKNLEVVITLTMTGEYDNSNGQDTDHVMDRTFTVSVVSRSIQQSSFDSAPAAAAELFTLQTP